MFKLQALKNKKGFTLIEIIVVLVILAILAAATIPSMLGFVQDARGKAYAAEARVGLVAAQAVVTEVVASGGTVGMDSNNEAYIVATGDPTIKAHSNFINYTKNSGVSGDFSKVTLDSTKKQVIGITYVTNGYTVVIAGNSTTVTKS